MYQRTVRLRYPFIIALVAIWQVRNDSLRKANSARTEITDHHFGTVEFPVQVGSNPAQIDFVSVSNQAIVWFPDWNHWHSVGNTVLSKCIVQRLHIDTNGRNYINVPTECATAMLGKTFPINNSIKTVIEFMTMIFIPHHHRHHSPTQIEGWPLTEIKRFQLSSTMVPW